MTYWIVTAIFVLYCWALVAALYRRRQRRLRRYLNARVKTRLFVPMKTVRKMDVNSEQYANQQKHGEQGHYE